MRKLFTKLSAFLLVLSFVFAMGIVPSVATATNHQGTCVLVLGIRQIPQGIMSKAECDAKGGNEYVWTAISDEQAQEYQKVQTDNNNSSGWWLDSVFKPFFGWIVNMILAFVSLLTGIAGIFLNGVIYHTVVNVADNYENIKSIDVAWKTVRDVANMGFIFILLYAAIMTIIGQGSDNQKLIVKVVVMAILINFSLFFTKVIIDMSNLFALMFYEAIVPGAASEGFKLTQTGLSQAFTQHLKLTSIFGASVKGGDLTIAGIITTGLMGSILLLIAAFSFFAVAFMFVIRYVVLIIVLILSPIAFMAFILPQLKPQATKWWDALAGQAIFAPVYFMLTWVTLKVLEGIMGSVPGSKKVFGEDAAISTVRDLDVVAGSGYNVGASEGLVVTFINFSVVIVFLIVSLILAKDWASKGPGAISSINKWATGKAGNLTFGATGRLGRNTLGLGAEKFKESATYKGLQTNAPNSRMARLALATANKTAAGSFDVRGSAAGGNLAGTMGAGSALGEGGYEAKKKQKEKERRERMEAARKAKSALDIENNLGHVREYDRLLHLENIEREGGAPLSAQDAAELANLRTTVDPNTGKNAMETFESAINNATNKEIEAIVKSNRDLLKSQEFANRINVQQLEAINKSDEFSEDEKKSLKDNRFAVFKEGSAGFAALAVPEAARTPEQKVAAKAASGAIKGLKDAELEMVDPTLLGKDEFVSNLRSGQIEAINKSTKFTASQRDSMRGVRQKPIKTALARAVVVPAEVKSALKPLGPAELAGLMKVPGRGGNMVAMDPYVLVEYKPEHLKRMAQFMDPDEIQVLRAALVTGGNHAVQTWLANPDNFS